MQTALAKEANLQAKSKMVTTTTVTLLDNTIKSARNWYAAKYAELAPDQREAEQTAFAEAVKANRDRLDDAQVTA